MRMPTFYLSHGGGPWPYLDGGFRSQFALLEQALVDIPHQLPAIPTAVLVISGHWEAPQFTVSAAAQPGMVYDYSGFPAHTYSISYPAPGEPALAARIQALLQASGHPVLMDQQRGYDHGTFSVLKPIYPDADVPVVQLSLKHGMDASEHLAVGQALAPLRDEGVLLIGSGMSYHNLYQLDAKGAVPSSEFDAWLRHTLLETASDDRWLALTRWQLAPAAYAAHPRADHLLPLMVAVGAAGADPATCVFGQRMFGNICVSSFRFGADRRPSAFDQLGRPEGNALVERTA